MTPQLRRIRRPATDNSPAFDLTYVREGRKASIPVVIIPGGPGLASVLPYRGLRRLATDRGLDVLMVEHRGVGLSRRTPSGRDLPASAMWIDDVLSDLEAVLNAEGIARAIVVGSSYGSHVAACFGAAHPDRVAGMVLDSMLQGGADLEIERRTVRALLWDADDELADLVRTLTRHMDQRLVLDVSRASFELGGRELAVALLRSKAHGRSPAWGVLAAYASRDESIARIPGIYEFDLAGTIGFRELHYGAPLDGLPLDPALTYAPLVDQFPPFHALHDDLRHEMTQFDWPMVFLVGARDLRTPPEIAEAAARDARDSTIVTIDNGHSALDTHPLALLAVTRRLVDGQQSHLVDEVGALQALPLRGVSARLGGWLATLQRLSRD